VEKQKQYQFKFKRLIVEAEWWLRSNVLCFGNFLYHTEDQVTTFVDSIRIKVKAFPDPEIRRHADMIASQIFYIAKQRNWIDYLEYELASPMRLFSDIEAITRQTENHHKLQKELTVKYHYGTENQTIDKALFNPADVICVLSYKKDDRRIILERKVNNGKNTFHTYIIDKQRLPNKKPLNYENLRYYLDPMQIHLVATTNAIFNVAFYHFNGDKIVLNPGIKLKVDIIDFEINKFKEIELHKRRGVKNKIHQDLITCSENMRSHLNSLQNLSSFYSFHKSKLEGQ